MTTSRELIALATADPIADQVIAWARAEISETLIRLSAILDPTALVLGGGLGHAFSDDIDYFRSQLNGKQFALSALGSRAVALGALMNVRGYLDDWLRNRLLMNLASGNRLITHRSKKRKVGP